MVTPQTGKICENGNLFLPLLLIILLINVNLGSKWTKMENRLTQHTWSVRTVLSVFVYIYTVWSVSVLAQRDTNPTDRWAGWRSLVRTDIHRCSANKVHLHVLLE